MITRLLASLGRRAPLILASGIFIGLALPDLAAFVRPLLTPSVFCMLVITMLRIDWPTVGLHMRSPARLTLSLGWVMILCPAAMALLVAPLDLPPGLKMAMVLYAAAPPLLTAPALALFAGLDGALALIVVVAAMFVYPVVLPPLAFALLGIDLAVGAIDLMLRLALLIGGAFGLAMLIRLRAGNPRIAELKHHLDGGLVVLMIVFAIATMDGIAARAMAEPAFVAQMLDYRPRRLRQRVLTLSYHPFHAQRPTFDPKGTLPWFVGILSMLRDRDIPIMALANVIEKYSDTTI